MTQQENLVSAQIDGGLHEKQTLLDDFAKAAMQGIVASVFSPGLQEELAMYAYDIAEAMMKERERRIKK